MLDQWEHSEITCNVWAEKIRSLRIQLKTLEEEQARIEFTVPALVQRINALRLQLQAMEDTCCVSGE